MSDEGEIFLDITLLLEIASASVCSKIVAANPQLANFAPSAVTKVIDEINEDIRNNSTDHAKARRKVRRRKYWNEVGDDDVQTAARGQNFERVVMALSVLAGCPIEIAERAVLSEKPGAVQVVAKAAGCSWATVKALLQIRAADRRMTNLDLDRAREHFERLEAETAKGVLEFYEKRSDIATETGSVECVEPVYACDTPSRSTEPVENPEQFERQSRRSSAVEPSKPLFGRGEFILEYLD